jgi:hypothetical protein
MAKATTTRFSDFLVLLGDGLSPETFTAPCGLTSRGFERTANMNATNVPDCADEDAPSWLEQDVISYQASISGAGVVADESLDAWEDWWDSGETKNCQVHLKTTIWEGPFKLQTLTYNGERGQRTNLTIALVSDGEIARQP